MASEVAKFPVQNVIRREKPDGKRCFNHFLIPNYQRGYRWTEREVTKLLNDIKAAKEMNKERYYLQPVVVQFVEQVDLGKRMEEKWSVIDGQQRLTTLFLLLYCLYSTGNRKAVHKITYESRPKNSEKMDAWIAECGEMEEGDEIPSMQFDNDDTLDIYYMSCAVETIKQWLAQYSLDFRSEMDTYIRENVYVLWYQFDEDEGDPIHLFSRINMGKIPLTVAELLKAMILRLDIGAVFKDVETLTTEETENSNKLKITRQVEQVYRSKQIQRAAEWDNMEKQLSDDDFFRFICADNMFGHENRMDYYFLILYLREMKQGSMKNLPTPSKEKLFDFFEEKVNNGEADQIWKDLKTLHKTLRDWYLEKDTEIFHKVGYLVAVHDKNESCANIICNLYHMYETSANKAEFKTEKLHNEIAYTVKALFKDKKSVAEFTYGESKKTKAILLLFNVLSAITSPDFRFSFDKVYPLDKKATLEHVFPQKPDPNTLKDHEMAEFMDRVEKEIEKIGGKAPARPVLKVAEANDNVTAWWNKACVALGLHEAGVDAEDRIQKIGNLALLSGNLNTKLSNDMFSGKQEKIKGFDKDGEYIPLCTHNAFLKYYSIADDAKKAKKDVSLMIWTLQDIENHEAAIEAALQPYLAVKEDDHE